MKDKKGAKNMAPFSFFVEGTSLPCYSIVEILVKIGIFLQKLI